MGLSDHSEKASKSALKISATGIVLSGLSADTDGEGAGVTRASEVEPANQITPLLSTVAAVAIEGEALSSSIFQSSLPVKSKALAKDLSALFP